MYIYSVHSRRRGVHTEDCCYSKRVKPANQRQFDTVEDAFASGFHRQRVAYPTLLPYFTYILEHDRYRKANPLRSPKSTKESEKRDQTLSKGAKRCAKAGRTGGSAQCFDPLCTAGFRQLNR